MMMMARSSWIRSSTVNVKSIIVQALGFTSLLVLTMGFTRYVIHSRRQLFKGELNNNMRRTYSNPGGKGQLTQIGMPLTDLLKREGSSPFCPSLRSVARERFLPNYYLHGQRDDRTKKQYKKSQVVFMHIPKCGGTTVKQLLEKVGKGQNLPVHKMSLAPQNELICGCFDDERRGVAGHGSGGADRCRSLHVGDASRRRIFMGVFSYGVCDILHGRPCSYFTVIRDPIEAIISSYLFCQEATDNCSNDVEGSITDWAVEIGGMFFGQLLLHGGAIRSGLHHQAENRRALLEYCLENLENWFSFIGLTDEMDMSMRMLEDVYDLPVMDVNHMNKGKTRSNMNQLQIDRMRQALLSNSTVMDVMFEDVMLYQKAQALFEIQVNRFSSR